MKGLWPCGKVVVRPINRARTTTSRLPSCSHNLCMHNLRTTSCTTENDGVKTPPRPSVAALHYWQELAQ